MAFNIYNKSNKPIYIDWKKSTFISNSFKSNYWTDKTIVNTAWGASSSGYSTAITSLSEASKITSNQQIQLYRNGLIESNTQTKGTTNATIESSRSSYVNTEGWSHTSVSKQERITFIPPRTYVTNSVAFKIKTDYYRDWKSGFTQTTEPLFTDTKKTTVISSKVFTKSNTPLDFRNFITLSFKEDFTNEFFIDNEFFIKEIIALDRRQFFIYKMDKSNNTISQEISPKYRNGVDFYLKTY